MLTDKHAKFEKVQHLPYLVNKPDWERVVTSCLMDVVNPTSMHGMTSLQPGDEPEHHI